MQTTITMLAEDALNLHLRWSQIMQYECGYDGVPAYAEYAALRNDYSLGVLEAEDVVNYVQRNHQTILEHKKYGLPVEIPYRPAVTRSAAKDLADIVKTALPDAVISHDGTTLIAEVLKP